VDRGPTQSKRLELFGGNVVSELLYALALGAACHVYGLDLSLAELVFVNTAASVLSSVISSPGGIGAAEASLTAGLIAEGVDDSTAFAIALTQRLCTSNCLRSWAYFSRRWLHKGNVWLRRRLAPRPQTARAGSPLTAQRKHRTFAP
jgi:hypothetical protein